MNLKKILQTTEIAVPDNPLAASIAKCVFISGLSRSTLYQLMHSGELPYIKINKRRLILLADLETFLLAHRTEMGAQ